jgi:hypothetical protein
MARPFPTVLSLAAALAASATAFAQDAPGGTGRAAPDGRGAADSQGATAAQAAAGDARPEELTSEADLRGIRCRVVLRRGAAVDGVLPAGINWERRIDGGFTPAKREDAGAGLRVFFVMGMDGEIFVDAAQVGEVVERGALSEEQAEEIRLKILAERRKALDERRKQLLLREAAVQAELERITAGVAPVIQQPLAEPSGDSSQPAPEDSGGGEEVAPEAWETVVGLMPTAAGAPQSDADAGSAAKPRPDEDLSADEKRRKGEALYERFPPPAWSEQRYELIDSRARIAKIAPDREEAEFVAGFKFWKEVFDRRQRAAADQKAASTNSGE